MGKIIEIHRNKSLRLDNVLLKNIFQISSLNKDDSKEEDDFSLDIEVEKLVAVVEEIVAAAQTQ